MPIYKNQASQKIAVYAFDPTVAAGTDPAKTGDAANITAKISKDGGTPAATNDVNPTQLHATNNPGIYIFDLTEAETNADLIMISAASSTTNILLDPVEILTTDDPTNNALITGNVNDGTPAAGNFDGDAGLSGTDDFYNGAVLLFTDGTLKGLARKIEDYTQSSKNLVFTANPFPAAPANGDKFVILGLIE